MAMIAPMRHMLVIGGLVLMCFAVVACARQREPQALYVDSTTYAQAFNHAKDVLREFRLDLDRIDARAGLMTTKPRASAGLATPWIPHSGGLAGSVEGLLEHEQRSATIRFLPAGAEELPPPELFDVREFEGQLEVRVEVELGRIHRPHRRPSVASIRLTSYAEDPVTLDPNLEEQYSVETLSDPALAARMTERLRARIDESN